MQIVPLRFCHIYKKERSVAFKIRQNPFSAWAVPRTPQGEFTTLPRSPMLGRGQLPHTPAPTHLRRSPCVPQNCGQIYDGTTKLVRPTRWSTANPSHAEYRKHYINSKIHSIDTHNDVFSIHTTAVWHSVLNDLGHRAFIFNHPVALADSQWYYTPVYTTTPCMHSLLLRSSAHNTALFLQMSSIYFKKTCSRFFSIWDRIKIIFIVQYRLGAYLFLVCAMS